MQHSTAAPTAQPVAHDPGVAAAAGKHICQFPQDPLSWALHYAARGWHVFPVGENKRPLTAHGFHDATTTPEQIRTWWGQWPGAGIGIACGASHLAVVDLDVSKGKRGIEAFEQFLGSNPHGCTLIATTPSGGRHYYYQDPDGAFGSGVDLGGWAGIDSRAVGGYVVAPSGDTTREWLDDGDPADGLAVVPAHIAELLPPCRGSSGPRTKGRMAPAGTAKDEVLEEVRSALFALDPSMPRMSGWLQLILSTHAALDADERGAELVEEWSSTTTVPGQYEEGEAWATYAAAVLPWQQPKGMPQRQLIDKGTLFKMARDRGWKWTPDDRAEAAMRAAIANAPPPSERAPSAAAEPFPMSLVEGDDLVSRMVRHIVETAMVPQPAMALGAVLATLGAVMGRCVQVLGSRTNLYDLIVGDTSSGKNHPRAECARLLDKAGMGDLVGPRTYMSGSGVYTQTRRQPVHVAYVDEFGLILAGMQGQKAPQHLRDIAIALLTIFSSAGGTVPGAAYADQRERPPEPIVEPCLSLVGFTTPTTLIEAISSKNLADGLLGRCLYFEADQVQKRRGFFHRRAAEKPSTVPVEALVADLQKLRAAVAPWTISDLGGPTGDRCRSVFWSDEAADYLDDVLLPTEERHRTKPVLGALWARLVEHACKVALVRAVARNPACDEIGLADLQWSETLVKWCLGRFERLLAEHLADSQHEADAKKVMRIIEKAGATGINGTRLHQRTRWLNGRERQGIMGDLVEGCYVVCETIAAKRADGKGRPTFIYRAARFAPPDPDGE